VKRLISFIVLLVAAPAAHAEVFTRVCLADGNTPLELADPCIPLVYRPIMVGTRLTIIIDSDANGYWDGEVTIWDANQNYGRLYGRDFNEETYDWKGSRFPAAGDMAVVWELLGTETVDGEEHDTKGFQFTGDDKNATPGDWFIIDYNAINMGSCSVVFFDRSMDSEHPLYQMSFAHVRTRDFNDDGIVNFEDFAVLGLNWQRTDCFEPENCSGTDLDADGYVGISDLRQFAEYWLEKTR
jgi:hypothetical protein